MPRIQSLKSAQVAKQVETDEGVAENNEASTTQQGAQKQKVYIFVGFSSGEMTAAQEVTVDGKPKIREYVAPPFASLKALGDSNGVEVVFIEGAGLSEQNSRQGQFIQALQDPNAIGVIFVGHGIGPRREEGPFIAEGLQFNASPTDPNLSVMELSAITDVRAKFIGIVACGAVNVGTSIQGQTPLLAMDGGTDGETSTYALGQVAYSMARSVVLRQSYSMISAASNNALAAAQRLNVKANGVQYDNNGDKVINPKEGW